jgi:hypothetical protein
MKTKFNLQFLGFFVVGMVLIGPSMVDCQEATGTTSKNVLLHVAVTSDGGGGFASGISRDSFLIVSDNLPRQMTLFQEGPPSSICIVLDTTVRLSMLRTAKGNIVLPSLTKGLAEFQNLAQNTEYSIVGVGESSQLILDWTKDLKAVRGAVASVALCVISMRIQPIMKERASPFPLL